jgi:hypothetical protein
MTTSVTAERTQWAARIIGDAPQRSGRRGGSDAMAFVS